MPPGPRTLQAWTTDGQNVSVRADNDGNLFTIPISIDQVSKGLCWYVQDRATLLGGRTFLIQVGAKQLDFWWNVTAGVQLSAVDLTEGVSFSGAGSAVTVQNYNRAGGFTKSFTVTSAPTGVSGGTNIFPGSAGVGTGLTPSSSSTQTALATPTTPIRLAANTNYTIAWTTIASILTTFNASFYEVQ